jgi:hypothetical protein
MFNRCFAGAIACALAILAAGEASAQACSPAEKMISAITGPKYREVPMFEATVKTARGLLPLRMFANPATGTWTIVTFPGDGVACLAGAGNGFKIHRPGRDA